MKEYSERSYRKRFAGTGRCGFTVEHRKTDVWVAVDEASYDSGMEPCCREILVALWREMEGYLSADPEYESSLVPYEPAPDAPSIFRRMSVAGTRAGIGPMSAVAGACAEHLAVELRKRFPYREIIIENGGDIYAELVRETDIAVFAGESPLSERVGFRIPALAPIGVCTSSGTVGPSLSFGQADAVMIVCRDVLLADSYATAFANLVRHVDDVDRVIERIRNEKDILAGMVVMKDRLGICGDFPLQLFGTEQSG